MEDKKFDHMNAFVEQMCYSLENESHLWEIETCTMKKTGTNIEYWISKNCYVTETWTDGISNKVFSAEQGKRIKESLDIARSKTATMQQRKLLGSIKPEKKDDGVTTKEEAGYTFKVEHFIIFILIWVILMQWWMK